MKFHSQQAIRSATLLIFSIFLFKLHYTGDITKYINPKYNALSQYTALLFLLFFFIQITRVWTLNEVSHHHCDHHNGGCTHDHGNSKFTKRKLLSYIIIIFPLMTGFLLPAKVLDASIANKKGAMLSLTRSNEQMNNNDFNTDMEFVTDVNENELHDSSLSGFQHILTGDDYEKIKIELDQSTIEFDDLVYSTFYEEINTNMKKYKGRKISLNGFVYKEDSLSQNQLVISRFLITHCVADSTIIGFLSEFPEASTLSEDTWISAEGELDITTYDGATLPLIKVTKWQEIKEPLEPYLYPVMIKRF